MRPGDAPAWLCDHRRRRVIFRTREDAAWVDAFATHFTQFEAADGNTWVMIHDHDPVTLMPTVVATFPFRAEWSIESGTVGVWNLPWEDPTHRARNPRGPKR